MIWKIYFFSSPLTFVNIFMTRHLIILSEIHLSHETFTTSNSVLNVQQLNLVGILDQMLRHTTHDCHHQEELAQQRYIGKVDYVCSLQSTVCFTILWPRFPTKDTEMWKR